MGREGIIRTGGASGSDGGRVHLVGSGTSGERGGAPPRQGGGVFLSVSFFGWGRALLNTGAG